MKDSKTGKMKTTRYTYQDWKTEEIYAKRDNWIVESPYEGNSFSDNFNIGRARLYSARFNVSLNDWVRTAKDSLPQKYKAMYGSTILKESSFIQSMTT